MHFSFSQRFLNNKNPVLMQLALQLPIENLVLREHGRKYFLIVVLLI